MKKFFSFFRKKILAVVMLCFLSVALVLTGCGEKPLGDNPSTDAQVYSNGGMTVVKGDYLYFVNGFVDASTLDPKTDNKLNLKDRSRGVKGALYRTKLNDGEIEKDKDGFLKNADLVTSKLVGFSNGGFYIYDDYIIYATPNMNYTSDGDKLLDRVEFHRIGINGMGDKQIYTTESAVSDTLEWTMYKVGDTIYMVVYDNSKIVVVNVNSGKTVKTVENTTSHAFLKSDTYNASKKDKYFETHIIYTRAITADDNVPASNYKGNVVCSLDIASGETETLEVSKDNTYTITHVNAENVYYTYTTTSVTIECLYRQYLSDNSSWGASPVKITNSKYNTYYYLDYGNELIIADDGEYMYLLEGGVNGTKTPITTASRTLVGIFGKYAYYVSEDVLVRFEFGAGEYPTADEVKPSEGGLSTTITNSNFIDFDGRRIYVYANYTAENGDVNLYLNYIDENFTADDDVEQRFVGVFESGDLPEKPEQPEEPEYEGDEIEYVPWID